jgi:hypothetical protein
VNSLRVAVSAEHREDSLASDSAYLVAIGDSTEVARPIILRALNAALLRLEKRLGFAAPVRWYSN